MNERPLLEVCTDSVEGVIAARDGGADRVELCGDLLEGGTTPSAGTIEVARSRRGGIGLMVMIRPRGGDFLYSELEFEVMKKDIAVAKGLGADGVALGILKADGTVDDRRVAELVAAARPLHVTFHRAFDMTRDLDEAFEALVELGVDRILTSGGQPTAPEGAARIGKLVKRAREAGPCAPIIMPGCGVREHNIRQLLAETGAREAHFSSGEVVDSAMTCRNESCLMGGATSSEYSRTVTSLERIKAYVRAARGKKGPDPFFPHG